MRNAILAMLALVVSAMGLVVGSTPTLAEILRCKGKAKTAIGTIDVRLDIILPESHEYNKALAMVDLPAIVDRTTIVGGINYKALGRIEIQRNIPSPSGQPLITKSRRHELIVTTRPDEEGGWSLVGLVLSEAEKRYPKVVKVDVWKENKPFVLADSGAAIGIDVYRGTCE